MLNYSASSSKLSLRPLNSRGATKQILSSFPIWCMLFV
ncbi:MAG: hypothetical protein OFPII_26270 [Osedax symbiont Rs1]|nr:MAG: hypothetical protein OFPII_26270 [Osedax symbiont Rs1]